MNIRQWFDKLPTYETMQPPRTVDWVVMESRKKRQEQAEEGAFCAGFVSGCLWCILLFLGFHMAGLV